VRDDFEKELQRILRRASRLRAALAGSADVVRVKVKACTVPEHRRGAHERVVIRMRKNKR
jgi:hypothetical protein